MIHPVYRKLYISKNIPCGIAAWDVLGVVYNLRKVDCMNNRMISYYLILIMTDLSLRSERSH